MTSLNQDRLIKQMFALLGAAGLAAFSGLPVLAQTNSSEQSQRSVNCSAYVNGGIGGPIDNGSSANNSSMTGRSSQSSYDTATIPQNRSSNAMNQSNNLNGMSVDSQFSAMNHNAAIPFRDNSPAGTSGGESNLNLQANGANTGSSMQSSQSSYDTATIPQNRSSYSMNRSRNSNGMRVDGQFSAMNPNAAIPFRTNGPAGTSGGESNLNLRAYRANNGSFMQSAMLSDNLTSSAYSAPTQASYSNQSATLVPVECLPGGANNR